MSEAGAALAEAGVDIFDASTRKFAAPAFEGSPLSLTGWTRKITGRPTAVGDVGRALLSNVDRGSRIPAGSPPEPYRIEDYHTQA